MQPLFKQEEQTVERKLKTARVALMRDDKFKALGGVMMLGKVEVVDNIPTACTNGRDELYGRAFINKLNPKALAFVNAHEVMHKAYRHLTVWRKLYEEDRKLANMACDYVINNMLVQLDPNETVIAMPRDENQRFIGLYDPRFNGMSAKQVFDILKQEKEKGGGGGGEGGLDEHDWEGAADIPAEERKQLEEDIERALRQGLMAGKANGGLERGIGELLRPKVDWREELREFIKSICAGRDTSSWRKPNRRFLHSDIYLPSMISERVGEIVVGIDTSGSIGGDILTTFLSEVKSIAEDVKPDKLHLLYWDHSVAAHEVYDEGSMGSLVQSTKPKGGGGTSPSCVSNYIKDKNLKPECIIILTDGEVGNDWGTWDAPVLWVIKHPNKKITAPVGKTINIEE
jgi:predicted metal-dependent peptidase